MQIEQFAHFLAVADATALKSIKSNLQGMLEDADRDMTHPVTLASAKAFKAAAEYRNNLHTAITQIEIALVEYDLG